jgi:uncharacterized RDD family membrane protein YckC
MADNFFRRIFANALDRTLIIYISSILSEGKIIILIILFLIFDFALGVLFRTIFSQTPGDIIFGIRIEAHPRFKIPLRWLLGYISPFTAFLLHIPAGQWRSLLDKICGIKVEKIN